MLLESNTALGQAAKQAITKDPKADDDEMRKLLESVEYFSFPLNISRIREEYAAKGYFTSGEPMKLQSPDRFSPMEMAGKRGEGDLIPVVSPGPSAVGGELALSQSLLALEAAVSTGRRSPRPTPTTASSLRRKFAPRAPICDSVS